MAGHLGRELGRSYAFPVQSLHLNNIPAVPHHEATGGFLPEAFNGATSAQGFVFKPDYGSQGGMMESHPGGGEVPRSWIFAGGDPWSHHPGVMMGPYMVPQSGEACPGPKSDIKVERDFEQPGPYNVYPWAGGCLMPSTVVRATPGNGGEMASPDNEPPSSSSPVVQLVELSSAESSPRSDGSQSPGGQLPPREVKEEGASGDEVSVLWGLRAETQRHHWCPQNQLTCEALPNLGRAACFGPHM